MFRLGIDTGGTFTDFVLVDAQGRLRVHKVLSTPDAPERAILEGIAQLGLDVDSLQLVHGSTVATNAVLEGKGVPTLYICNRGFADLLTIGRQQRAELYNLQPAPMPPPVAPECCVEVGGRLDAHGTLLDPLTDEDLGAVRDAVQRLAPRRSPSTCCFPISIHRSRQASPRRSRGVRVLVVAGAAGDP